MAIVGEFFFSGIRLYRYQKPGSNPLTRLCQVLMASLRKYQVEVPNDKSLLYETVDIESTIASSRKLDRTNQFCAGCAQFGSSHCGGKEAFLQRIVGTLLRLMLWKACPNALQLSQAVLVACEFFYHSDDETIIDRYPENDAYGVENGK
ncbi:UNVERIFIED_CONTAM: protein NRT1/ PTR FAMILY 8.3 [Sesamum radiatum]|uniref:Protein NRT1/ PTR FAMILY 8.3 n=1 Tax=Sesamum radiatum TaxID=300843 RepID=A0AAW2RDS2_SESRA